MRKDVCKNKLSSARIKRIAVAKPGGWRGSLMKAQRQLSDNRLAKAGYQRISQRGQID